MDLTTIQLIASISGTVASVVMMIYALVTLKKTKSDIIEVADGYVEAFTEFYKAEKADLAEAIPKMIGGAISAPIFSQMGKKSGVSRQLKGLEKDVISKVAGQALGNPALGGMAAGLLQKHPVLASLLPMLMKGRGGPQGQPSTGNNGGVGYG